MSWAGMTSLSCGDAGAVTLVSGSSIGVDACGLEVESLGGFVLEAVLAFEIRPMLLAMPLTRPGILSDW